MLRATLLYSFLVFLPTLSVAGDNERIARCFSENGDIIYSDVFCSTFENNNPHFMTEGDVGRNIRATELPLISSGTLSTTELASITDQAVSQCNKKFGHYFKRKHYSASNIPAIAFTDVIQQYKKGSNVSISVAGALHYVEGGSNKTVYVECTAQKLNASTNWQVGFLEK